MADLRGHDDRPVHGLDRRDDREHHDPGVAARSRRQCRHGVVGPQRLQHHVRRPARVDGAARGPVRAQAVLHRRHVGLHDWVAALRVGKLDRRADRLPRVAGDRRGDARAARAGHDRTRLPARAARARSGADGRRGQPRRRDRPPPRRPAGGVRELALDLRDQRSGGADRDSACDSRDARDLRPDRRHEGRLGRDGPDRRRGVLPHLRPGRGELGGLGVDRDRPAAERSRGAGRGVRSLPAVGAIADAHALAGSKPAVHGRERGDAAVRGRRDGHAVPGGDRLREPVGLLADRGRARDHADRRAGPGGFAAGGPPRRPAPAPRHGDPRTRVHGHRARVARRRPSRPRPTIWRCCRRWCSSGSGWGPRSRP